MLDSPAVCDATSKWILFCRKEETFISTDLIRQSKQGGRLKYQHTTRQLLIVAPERRELSHATFPHRAKCLSSLRWLGCGFAAAQLVGLQPVFVLWSVTRQVRRSMAESRETWGIDEGVKSYTPPTLPDGNKWSWRLRDASCKET